MKHFSVWQWTDFSRGLVEAAPRSAMEAHLSSGCPRCERLVNVMRDVADTARVEAAYEPPDYAIRYARAIFSSHHPEKVSFPQMVARLVYDSMLAPLPAGLRSQDRLSRHAVYEAGSYSLDVQLEEQPRSGMVTLIGQLANRNQPAFTPEVPVWLMARKDLVASTVCNRFGEFELEFAPAPNLRLQVPLAAEQKRLDVSLNRLNPRPAGPPRRPRQLKRKASGGGLTT